MIAEVFYRLCTVTVKDLRPAVGRSGLRYDLVLYELFPDIKARGRRSARERSRRFRSADGALARTRFNADNRILLIDERPKGAGAAWGGATSVDALRRAAEVVNDRAGGTEPARRTRLVRDVIVLDQGRVSFTGDVDALIERSGTIARKHLGLVAAGAAH